VRFSGKVAVITGAASGIGLETVRLFVREGANVVMADLDAAKGESEAAGLGGQAAFIRTDVGDAQSVIELFERVRSEYGRLDVLFNNAGIESASSLLETSEAEWDRVIRVNLKGVFLCSREAARIMSGQRSGAIVHTASERGLVGAENSLPYTAAKGGVVIMAKSMALELAPYGVRVNCVCPGATDTPMLRRDFGQRDDAEAALREAARLQPLGGLGQPLDVAHAVAFLASDEARYITGVALPVDGGFTAR
jgi:NAD(P)-dependent dehydrogenase (short-subunit alcohol dehydrogenase family)